MIDKDFVICWGVVSFLFCSFYGVIDEENDDQNDKNENSNYPQNVRCRVRALSTLEVWSCLISNFAISAENSLVADVALSITVVSGLFLIWCYYNTTPKLKVSFYSLQTSCLVSALNEVRREIAWSPETWSWINTISSQASSELWRTWLALADFSWILY